MDFLRLILFICYTTFLVSIIYATSVPQNDVTRQIRDKLGISDGPVYTFVKTDKKANIKWGVRHYLPRKN